jgi:Uma2 family endonuclease
MVLTKVQFTVQEYFDLCERLERVSDVKLEYYEGIIYPLFSNEPIDTLDIDILQHLLQQINMPKPNHATIGANLITAFGVFSYDYEAYKVYDAGLQVRINLFDSYVHPDVTISNMENEVFENNCLTNPLLIVEILSDSTESRDRKEKLEGYQSIHSLMEYVMVAQDRTHIEHYVRSGKGWFYDSYKNINDVIEFQSIALLLPLKKIYRNVVFEK